MLNGTPHYFYGHFQWQTVELPEEHGQPYFDYQVCQCAAELQHECHEFSPNMIKNILNSRTLVTSPGSKHPKTRSVAQFSSNQAWPAGKYTI